MRKETLHWIYRWDWIGSFQACFEAFWIVLNFKLLLAFQLWPWSQRAAVCADVCTFPVWFASRCPAWQRGEENFETFAPTSSAGEFCKKKLFDNIWWCLTMFGRKSGNILRQIAHTSAHSKNMRWEGKNMGSRWLPWPGHFGLNPRYCENHWGNSLATPHSRIACVI